MKIFRRLALGLTALPVVMLGSTMVTVPTAATAASALPSPTLPALNSRVVGLRRLTEAQYRNTVLDIFGPEIKVAGRFEPIIRPAYSLLAVTSGTSTISAAGLEQFDAMARNVADQVFNPTYRGYFVKCMPANKDAVDANCVREVLTPIGRFLFRRPLTTAEQAFYVKMAGDATAELARNPATLAKMAPNGAFYDGMKLALASMMVDPNFLYVVESAEPDPAKPGSLRLDNYSRASRLSFLLWDTTPNEALLSAAAEGKLTNQVELSAIAAKMAHSPRVEGGVRAFFSDMLLFEKFDDISKDPVVFPRYNGEVAAALPEQMLRTIVDVLVTRGAPYPEIFTTKKTFMNRALGPVYEVPVKTSAGWVPYEFGPTDDRAGILTLAGFLSTGPAQVGRSSPTNRGRTVREQLLCQEVREAPGTVNFDSFQKGDDKAKPTARIRMSSHNNDPVCAGCHSITDPIGMSLERFDGLGSHRVKENGARIDISGEFDGIKYATATGLGRAMAASKDATRCVTGRLFEYATGRANPEDSPLVPALEKSFAASRYNFPALLQKIATMPEAYRFSTEPLAPRKVTINLLKKRKS